MMRYSIHQVSATAWELRSESGEVVGTFNDAAGRTGYDLALTALNGIITAELAAESANPDAATAADGLLPESWMSDQGIAFQERLAGGRDFTECVWSWRDPSTSLVALMLQTETDYGHMGAELAGFCEEFSGTGPVTSRGRFYDNEIGIQARDLLLDGRRFGVSVDPTENIETEFRCTEYDDDGWCMDGDFMFLAYEIGGVTMTPFPGFEQASIVLDPATVNSDAETTPMRIAASAAPTQPPRAWFELAEPALGVAFLDGVGDDVLVDQGDGSLACPLTITDDGQVYGHLARWGQCHTGEPWGPGVCAEPQPSASNYASFHVSPGVVCDDGSRIVTGSLVVGAEHSYASSAWAAMDHYANAGSGWADVRAIDGEYGPFVRGALRPGLSAEQLRVLSALTLSGEWRDVAGNLELIGILAVNAPGFPIVRSQLAASGYQLADSALRITTKADRITRMSGAGVVSRCPECQKRRQVARDLGRVRDENGEVIRKLDDALARLAVLEQRTRPMVEQAAELARTRLHAPV